MIEQEKINEWKEKYGYIYRTIIQEKEIIYKTLTREDYIDILTIQAKNPVLFDHDIEVFKKCVLTEYDENELKKKAGLTTVVAEKIMLSSGFEMAESEEL